MTNFAKPSINKKYAERKRMIAAVKIASGCVDCRVWGPAEILTFDHVRGTKEFCIGQKWDASLERLQAEMAKCEIVCFNCHQLRTVRRHRSGDGPEFVPMYKIPRSDRIEFVVTEKVDGSCGMVWVTEDGYVMAGSKTRWLSPNTATDKSLDNFGFAEWVAENETTLAEDLGEGLHRGEWYGAGIQRKYGLTEKRFALFNTTKWTGVEFATPRVDVVPVLYQGDSLARALGEYEWLKTRGSKIVPGWTNPEGIVVREMMTSASWKLTDAPAPKGPKDKDGNAHA